MATPSFSENRQKYNPHDDRPGTFHCVCLDSGTGKIVSGLSVAIDIGDCEKGEPIGLPLENRWGESIYPVGPSLDPFRERYLRLNFDCDRNIAPWDMAEIYRHFKCFGSLKSGIVPRLAVYNAAYHLLAREARRNEVKPTAIVVIECVPQLFQLYRFAAAAVLRDATIEKTPRFISPGREHLVETIVDGKKAIAYNGKIISRNMRSLVAVADKEELAFRMEDIPVMDGLINIDMIERAIKESPLDLSPIAYDAMSESDIGMLRTSLAIIGKHVYDEYHGDNEVVNTWAQESRKLLTEEWDFK